MNLIKLNIYFFVLLAFSVGLSANEEKEDLLARVISSPYEACKNIILVSKDSYEKNKESWKNFESKCKRKIQIMEESGLTQLMTLNESAEYLNLTHKVTDHILETLEKSRKYAECSALCFSGANSCSKDLSTNKKSVNCQKRRQEILNGIKREAKNARAALALSQEASDLVTLNIHNVLILKDEERFNSDLRDFEIGPNPIGRMKMSKEEMEHYKIIMKQEREKAEIDYKEMIRKTPDVKDSDRLHRNWMSKHLMDTIDKRKEANQEKFRTIIYEKFPLFSVLDKPNKFENEATPVWEDQEIAKAFSKLATNAKKTKESVVETKKQGSLEFKRYTGQATWKWFQQLIPGSKDKNDLLFYMGLKNQVEEVLKKDSSLCGAATTLNQRLDSRNIQNSGLTFMSSFLGGPMTKGISKAASGMFKIGRALTGAETGIVTGLALGGAYLGDSMNDFRSTEERVTSGIDSAENLAIARSNLKMNLIFAPTLVPGGWTLGKKLYSSLGEKMSKDLPELSALLSKVNLTDAERDLIVDKWIWEKAKQAVKSKLMSMSDVDLLKTEMGSNVLNQLVQQLEKTNPNFFKDPNNVELFLKAAAVSIKGKASDLPELKDKAFKIFSSLKFDEFDSWDPEARAALMKVYEETVEVLRNAPPQVFVMVGNNAQATEKIFEEALRKAGVAEKDINAMKACAIR